jgi:NAD(P)H-hydrate epimerase
MVLDADALNILAENKNWLERIPKYSILTPHIGELKRLIGEPKGDFEQLELTKEFANKYEIYVVIKGAHSAIVCPNREVFFNTTGNPGMATAGSGDVLTGIITGLLAQGYIAVHAAMLGVYVHGYAGDLALKKGSRESVIASDIINKLGKSFSRIWA